MGDATDQPLPNTAVLLSGTGGPLRPAGGQVPLEVGQRVIATIQDLLPGDRYLVSLLGHKVEASSRLELPVGSSVVLQVRAVSPRIELGLVGPVDAELPARGSGPLDVAALALRSLGAALEELRGPQGPGTARPVIPAEVFDLLARVRDASPDGAMLRALHSRLGLLHEARVARSSGAPPAEVEELRNDLKSALLTSQEEAPPASRPAVEDALLALDAFEAHEARRAAMDAPFMLPLSVLPGGWMREGRLFVVPDGRGDAAHRPASRTVRLVFLLDLTRLGALRVDATVEGTSVSARFRFVRAASVRLVEGRLSELRAGLEAAGLRPGELSVERVRGREIPVADLVLSLPPPEAPLLDTRA